MEAVAQWTREAENCTRFVLDGENNDSRNSMPHTLYTENAASITSSNQQTFCNKVLPTSFAKLLHNTVSSC